jgi:hypothetical protein
MGNYKLNEVIAQELKTRLNAEVMLLEQLNGRPLTPEYTQQVQEYDPDIVYYEMLDLETFKLVEKLKNAERVLLFASAGVLKHPHLIREYYGKWYDKIYTNSTIMQRMFYDYSIPHAHFKYYPSVVGFAEDGKFDPNFEYNQKYDYDAVFLGMGFHRRESQEYATERKIFFNPPHDFSFGLFGNGWDGHPNWKGLLPPEDIGNLYRTAGVGFAMIAGGQRRLGMINNRYVEMVASMCHIISFPYKDVDWFGLEKYITFCGTKHEVESYVKELNNYPEPYKLPAAREFMRVRHEEFFQKLIGLIHEGQFVSL